MKKKAIFCRQLLHDKDEIIEYETGLSALNKIGLVSQIPKRICMASNLHQKRVPEGIQVEVRKPPAMVGGNNYQPLPRTAHKETKKYLTITAIKGTIISIDPATPMAVYDSYAQPGGAFHFEEVYKFSFPIYAGNGVCLSKR